MKKILSLLIIGLFTASFSLLAKEPQKQMSDDELSHRMLQTWMVHVVYSPVDVPNHFAGVETFTSNGKFALKGAFTVLKDKEPLEYEGTWNVKDGFLVETVTKSSRPAVIHVGAVTRDKIVRVDDRELVYQTEQGKTVTRKRKPHA